MNNEKFLNQTGLAYYHDRAKTIFENKIEKVKVNSTEQAITNKEVNLYVPVVTATNTYIQVNDGQETKGIRFTETANGYEIEGMGDSAPTTKELVDKTYVDTNAGKIDKIKVNGTEQTITNKEVDLKVVEAKGVYNEGVLQQLQLNQSGEGVTFFPTDNGFLTLLNNEGATIQEELTSKEYVDGKGSIAIDSTNNNKTTFTVGSKTSSLTTSPDGVIYTEGATATEVPSKAYVDDAIADITGMEFVIVPELPTEGQKGKIYLLGNESAGSNVYDEYIWVQDGANGRFEKMGSTDVDLSNYWNNTNLTAITTAEIDALFA